MAIWAVSDSIWEKSGLTVASTAVLAVGVHQTFAGDLPQPRIERQRLVAEVIVDVRAGQNSMQFAVPDQNAGSLRGGRVPSSGEADGELLYPVEHGVRNVFRHENPCYQMPPGAHWSYRRCGQVCDTDA